MPTVLPPPSAPTDAPDDDQPPHGGQAQPAHEAAASHRTQLALARWRAGRIEENAGTAQARWHAELQEDFTDWLQSGGFRQ